MHWGIRRYQPYSTVPRKSGKSGTYKPTTKADKAKLWKEREIERQAGRYDRKEKVIDSYIQKKQKKLAEVKKTQKDYPDYDYSKKISKLERKIDYGETQKRINSKLKTAEIKKIKDIKLEDVSKERFKKGAYYTAQAVKSAGVKTLTIGALAGGIAAFDAAGRSTKEGARLAKEAGDATIRSSQYQSMADYAYKKAGQAMGGKVVEGMTFDQWKTAFHDSAGASLRDSGLANTLWYQSSKAMAVANSLKALGFGLGATAAGSAALNFTKIGRINEYSHLNRQKRKAITNIEMRGDKKRSEQSKLKLEKHLAQVKKSEDNPTIYMRTGKDRMLVAAPNASATVDAIVNMHNQQYKKKRK